MAMAPLATARAAGREARAAAKPKLGSTHSSSAAPKWSQLEQDEFEPILERGRNKLLLKAKYEAGGKWAFMPQKPFPAFLC